MTLHRTGIKAKTRRHLARWLKPLPAEVLDQPVLVSTGADEFGETTLYPITDLIDRLCEDEGIIMMHLHKVVTLAGCEVVGEATTGEQAVTLAHEIKPDLILMDLTLAGPQDALSAAREILAERRVPIVMLTGINDPETIEEAETAGIVGFFVKPLYGDEIIAAVQRALDRFHATGGATGTAKTGG